DSLVAEHEADVTVGDFATPAAHRGGGDLLREKAMGDLHTVEPEGSDVEEKRPGSRRAHHGKAVKLPERLVAPSLPFSIGGSEVVVGRAKGNARSDLGEPARHEAVVDLHTRDIVHELA